MNLRSTTPASARITRSVCCIALLIFCIAITTVSPQVLAESNEAKIERLEAEIKAHETQAVELNQRSNTLESLIGQLSTERNTLQRTLTENQKRQTELSTQATASETKLKQYQEALGNTLADLYVADAISPLELLASSGSIAKYIDQQEYRQSINTQLQQTIGQIRSLKRSIIAQQAEVKRLIVDQQNQQRILADKQGEQQSILSATQGSETKFVQLSTEKAAEKKRLQEQQQESISDAMDGAVYVPAGTISQPVPQPKPATPAPTAPSQPSSPAPSAPSTPAPKPPQPTPPPAPVVLPNGGYPSNLANCYVDSNAMSYGIDPWGYGCRQCVSYTAWKVLQKSGRAPMYWGNANQWPNSARNRGYTVSSTPRAGSVGVMMSGPYGHVVWVESVNGNGTINISQYNYWLRGMPNGGWGHYSEFKNVSASAYQSYIYI